VFRKDYHQWSHPSQIRLMKWRILNLLLETYDPTGDTAHPSDLGFHYH
jgi:hypothetical protein